MTYPIELCKGLTVTHYDGFSAVVQDTREGPFFYYVKENRLPTKRAYVREDLGHVWKDVVKDGTTWTRCIACNCCVSVLGDYPGVYYGGRYAGPCYAPADVRESALLYTMSPT